MRDAKVASDLPATPTSVVDVDLCWGVSHLHQQLSAKAEDLGLPSRQVRTCQTGPRGVLLIDTENEGLQRGTGH